MSNQPSAFTGNSNVISFIPTRKGSQRIIALVIVLAVISIVTAIRTTPDAAGSQNSTALETAESPNASTESAYFPGQYVNRATEPSEHIEAF